MVVFLINFELNSTNNFLKCVLFTAEHVRRVQSFDWSHSRRYYASVDGTDLKYYIKDSLITNGSPKN